MGILVKAECSCGYSSEVLSEGCGMMGPLPRFALALCSKCAEVTSIAVGEGQTCPECRGRVELIPEMIDDGLTANAPRSQVVCPKCGRQSLGFVEVGNWD